MATGRKHVVGKNAHGKIFPMLKTLQSQDIAKTKSSMVSPKVNVEVTENNTYIRGNPPALVMPKKPIIPSILLPKKPMEPQRKLTELHPTLIEFNEMTSGASTDRRIYGQTFVLSLKNICDEVIVYKFFVPDKKACKLSINPVMGILSPDENVQLVLTSPYDTKPQIPEMIFTLATGKRRYENLDANDNMKEIVQSGHHLKTQLIVRWI